MGATWLGENRTCRECGAGFVVTRAAQAFFISRNLDTPRRCSACRALRRRPNPSDDAARANTLPVETGLLKACVADGAFGFIQPDLSVGLVFVHATILPDLDTLVGRRLRFTARETPKGRRATWAEVAGPADASDPARRDDATSQEVRP